MFTALIVAALIAPSNLVSSSATVQDLQADFETAIACRDIDGRKVWKGEIAYYIQSFVYDGGTETADTADAVLPEDNAAETIKEFEDACAVDSARSSR